MIKINTAYKKEEVKDLIIENFQDLTYEKTVGMSIMFSAPNDDEALSKVKAFLKNDPLLSGYFFQVLKG